MVALDKTKFPFFFFLMKNTMQFTVAYPTQFHGIQVNLNVNLTIFYSNLFHMPKLSLIIL